MTELKFQLDLASATIFIHDLNLDKDDHDKNIDRFCFGSLPWAIQNCSMNEQFENKIFKG